MRALVLTGPQQAEVTQVPDPEPGPGQVVVDVRRVGVCGTDIAFFNGTMPYLATGRARYPLRPGHEWAGVVSAVGDEVGSHWLGRRVTGDTMLGCGRCDRCGRGLQHVCAHRFEVGVLHGWDGALAERVLVPASSLFALPDAVSFAAGAFVEPSANAQRAVADAGVTAGGRVAVIGPGTLGLMAVAFAAARGAQVLVVGRTDRRFALAAAMGATRCVTVGELTSDDVERTHQVVIEASGGHDMPQLALDLVEPGGVVALMGIAPEPSTIDTRQAVTTDVTMIGNLSGSPAMAATIAAFAGGTVDPLPLLADTLPLAAAAEVLAGRHPGGPAPKVQFAP